MSRNILIENELIPQWLCSFSVFATGSETVFLVWWKEVQIHLNPTLSWKRLSVPYPCDPLLLSRLHWFGGFSSKYLTRGEQWVDSTPTLKEANESCTNTRYCSEYEKKDCTWYINMCVYMYVSTMKASWLIHHTNVPLFMKAFTTQSAPRVIKIPNIQKITKNIKKKNYTYWPLC